MSLVALREDDEVIGHVGASRGTVDDAPVVTLVPPDRAPHPTEAANAIAPQGPDAKGLADGALEPEHYCGNG